MSEPNAPAMSVIVLTPDCLETVRKTLKCVGAQSVRGQLEIVIVLPSQAQLDLCDPELEGFAGIQVVRICEMRSTSAARAAGIRQASAPIVAFVEDHSFPEAVWADALISAHRQPWAAVGPVMLNANPKSAMSWANLLIEYGEWLEPWPVRQPHHLPGHNCSYKRLLLLEYGDRLGAMMAAESVLHWDLRARGYAITIERKARTGHLNFSRFFPSAKLRLLSGRTFSAARSRDWPRWKRLIYVGGSPLIPFVRLWRIMRQMRRRKWHGARAFQILALALFLLVLDAGGEAVGLLLGPGEAEQGVAAFEFHRSRYLSQSDLKS